MRVCVLAGMYPPDIKGGGEISTRLLAQMLAASGCEVGVLTCAKQPAEEEADRVRIRRIVSPNVYWSLEPGRRYVEKAIWHLGENWNPRARSDIRRFLGEFRPDLVVTSTLENFGAEAWTAPFVERIPTVHILRSYYPFCWKGSAVRTGVGNCEQSCRGCVLLTRGRRIASQRVAGVVGISRYILDRHRREGLFSQAASVVIPEPLTAHDYGTPKRSGFSGRFGYLGVLSSDKGLETLASAWRQAGLDQASLSVAGRGRDDYVQSLRPLFGASTDFKGWVDSKAYLAGIDVLVVPSVWNEPFGRIVIEAFAQGMPVIGSRIGGIAETIEDGKNGFLFSPGDAGELAGLLRRCAGMAPVDYRRLSSAAAESSLAYEASRISRDHIDFYEDVLRQHHDRGAGGRAA